MADTIREIRKAIPFPLLFIYFSTIWWNSSPTEYLWQQRPSSRLPFHTKSPADEPTPAAPRALPAVVASSPVPGRGRFTHRRLPAASTQATFSWGMNLPLRHPKLVIWPPCSRQDPPEECRVYGCQLNSTKEQSPGGSAKEQISRTKELSPEETCPKPQRFHTPGRL